MKTVRALFLCVFAVWSLGAAAQVSPLGAKAYAPEAFNGVPADKRTSTYMVALLKEGLDFPAGFMCGASIIANDWVLTAAHCLYDDKCNKLKFTSLYAIGGTVPLKPGLPRMDATAVRPHPGFRCIPLVDMIAAFKAGQPIPMGNDIGLVRLDGVRVPDPALVLAKDRSDAAGQLVASGWGTLGNGGAMSSKLNSVQLATIALAQCVQAWSPSTLSSDQLCVMPPSLSPPAGICSGDSGGPLVATVGLNRVQAGIVSLGHLVCNMVDRPSLFTNVFAHRPWIEENVGAANLAVASSSCTPAAIAANIC
ncbi:serine protease [Acidovorax sp. NCPPB 2350]|nr:serine protease [Acidovorax sp. NCPPB 2350]